MANLPDLNKSDIGIVAYWNGIDNTAASDISPGEVLTEGTIQSYSQYDNGVEGEVQVSYDGVGKTMYRNIGFRVKDDGWFIVWLDRTENYGVNNGPGNRNGYWDIAGKYPEEGSRTTFPNSTLFTAMSRLAAELSNGGTVDPAANELKYYSYHYSSATNIEKLKADNGGSGKIGGSLSYPSTITRHHHSCQSSIGRNSDDVSFNGLKIIDGGAGDDEFGARDIMANNAAPNDSTTYSNSSDDITASGTVVHMVMWS